MGIQPAGLRPGDRERQRARRRLGVDDGKGDRQGVVVEFGGDDFDLFFDLFFCNFGRLQLRRLLRRGRRAPRPARRCGGGSIRRETGNWRWRGVEEGARAAVPRPRREPAVGGAGRGAAAALSLFLLYSSIHHL